MFIRIPEREAPRIRLASQNGSLTLNILAKPKFIISNETTYKCGEGNYWWHLNQEKFEYIITQKPHLINACTKLKVKIKSIKYEIVNFNLVNNSSGEIYWK